MNLHIIVLALAPVFFVMGLGFAAGRLKIVAGDQVDGLNALVMDFALPASLFVATASASRQDILAQAPLFGILGAVMLLLYAGWYLARRLGFKTERAEASIAALTIAFPNLAGVGLPFAAAVLGPAGTAQVAVAVATGAILVSRLTLAILEREAGAASGKPPTRPIKAFQRAVTKPVVLAPIFGILIALSGWRLGPAEVASLSLIGHAAAGTALFLTGLILAGQPFRLDGNILIATGVANVGRPLLTAVIVRALPIDPATAKAANLLAATPSGFIGILFASKYRLKSSDPSSMVTASTVVSLVTLAVAIALIV